MPGVFTVHRAPGASPLAAAVGPPSSPWDTDQYHGPMHLAHAPAPRRPPEASSCAAGPRPQRSVGSGC